VVGCGNSSYNSYHNFCRQVRLLSTGAEASPLAYQVAMVAAAERHDVSTGLDLLRRLVEERGLAPDSTVETVLLLSAPDAASREAVVERLSGYLGREPISEGVTLEEVKRRVDQQLTVNPHDELRRRKIALMGLDPMGMIAIEEE
jgi:hypothetical protein